MSVEVLREALRRLLGGERVGLATVVATRGSTPQKAGARVLVHRGERAAGTLGGGAVEAEAVREADAALALRAPALREYVLANGTDDWGLACGGTMVVLVEALDAGALTWLRAVDAAATAREALAVVTPVEGSGAGGRLLVRESGLAGSLGDPALDREATEIGRRVLAAEGAELAEVTGARVFAEAFAPLAEMVIVGAGHVGHALAALARCLGVEVTVVDDRVEYATRERFPAADRVIAAPAAETLRSLRVGPSTAIVVAMRSHDLDYEATAAALRTPARYVGLIGARRKAILVAERLIAEGLPVARARELRSPIGLDIGARTPEEIAVSIVGEWIMLRRGGGGAPLRLVDELFDKAAARAGGAGLA